MDKFLELLYEKGIETVITLNQDDVIIELKFRKAGSVIGVAKGKTLEDAMSTLVLRLAESKNSTISNNNFLKNFDKLTEL